RAGLPKNAIVAAIVRNSQTIIPRGDERILPGDRLIVFVRTSVVPKLAQAVL
ncbi:MAG: TrkA C-terminal domain-containing protein, partial [Thermoplasmata archaeon]